MNYQEEILRALDETDWAGDRAGAADLLMSRVTEAAKAGDSEAIAAAERAEHRGHRGFINDFCRTGAGRLAAATRSWGRSSVPAGKSVHRRNSAGDVQQLYLPMLDLLFDELRLKAMELGAQRNQLMLSVAVAARLLELQVRVPSAHTPQDALTSLGVTVDAWLAGMK